MDLQSPKRPTRSAKEQAIDNDLIMLFGATGSSISINVLGSYQELYDLVVNEELTPGNWYKFPYRSVNFLNGWEDANQNTPGIFPSYDARELYVGDEEIILVQAISAYEIASNAYSESYQGDVIQFAPYTNKIGVGINITNGATIDFSILSGFDLQWDGTNVYFDMPLGYPALFGQYLNLQAEFNDGVDTYYQQGIYEPLTPGVSICQYPSSTIPMPTSRLKIVNGGTKVILLDLTQSDVTNYIANSLSVDTIYAIGDAYGWITRRTDTLRNISTPFDFRGRKYRRYEIDRFGFITEIVYSATGSTATDGSYVIPPTNITSVGQNATLKVTVSLGAVTDIQIVNKGRFYTDSDTIFIDGSFIGGVSGNDDITITVAKVTSDVGFWSIGNYFYQAQVPSDIYSDFKVFTENYTNINIQWNGVGGPNANNYSGYSDNNVFRGTCSNVTIEDSFFKNTINDSFFKNTISNSFYENNIGYDFYENIIDNTFGYNTIDHHFYKNIIGNKFGYNTIGNNFFYNNIGSEFSSNIINNHFAYNKIGNYFYQNIINDGFGFGFNSSQGNVIGNYFYNNIIGEYFYNNFISDGFSDNTTVIYFQLNDIKAFAVSNQDFTLSTYVYGNYNCSIFSRSDGSLRLSYIDNTDTINYETITD